MSEANPSRPPRHEFVSQTQQSTEEVYESTALLAASATEESAVIESEGYGALLIFAISDTSFRIDFLERCTCDDEDDEEPMPDEARTSSVTSTLDSTTGRQFIATTFTIHGKFVQLRRTNLGGTTQTLSRTCAYLLPVAPGSGGGGGGSGGTGSESGPGLTIVTKADLTIPAGVETAALLAADIPTGTRRVTIKNVGANSVRLKETGAGGGASRGMELDADDTISIGTDGGAIATLDAFSTSGTTLAFFFERD